MKIVALSILSFFYLGVCAQAVYTVETVPNTKLVNGSYVSDPDNILNPATVTTINNTLKTLEDSTTAQIAVVMLSSIGGNDVFDFAENLFNRWGLGQEGNDNGLLILYVGDQKTIRFHTGEGMEPILPDARCKQIQRDYMVPKFKEGDVDAGMIEGITATAKIIADPNHTEEVVNVPQAEEASYTGFMIAFFLFYGVFFCITWFIKSSSFKFADSAGRDKSSYPAQSLTRNKWLIVFGLIPSAIVILFSLQGTSEAMGSALIVLYLYFIGTLVARLVRMQRVINRLLKDHKYFEATDIVKKSQFYWLFVGLVFPVPFFIYFFIHLYRKRLYRNYPRTCRVCQSNMKKLSEKDDDEFLSESARMEEQLKSGNYDVWLCPSCKATEEWFYKNKWSKYEECPKCRTLAFFTKSTRTLRSATYSSSGQGERTKSCKFCNHIEVSTYSIAQLERSTSSSGFSSSGSSSSGGSWGGGSSSGGGASSSW